MTDKQLIARAYHTLARQIERKSYAAIFADWLRGAWETWREMESGA